MKLKRSTNKEMKIAQSAVALILMSGLAAFGQSPALLDWGESSADAGDQRLPFADPFVLQEDGVYYAYGTHEKDGIAVATSSDLKRWTVGVGRSARGLALHKDDSFGETKFWAPEVHRRKDGRYVMFYSAECHVCTAVADSPFGPFVQPKQRPLFPDGFKIDNTLALDDDGTPWMFYGRGREIWQVRMTDDWLSVRPETDCRAVRAEEPWESVTHWTAEGPSVVKTNGRWWLLYSANDCRSPDYSVGFATADRLTGPWRKPVSGNPILRRTDGLSGVGHGAPFRDAAGRWRYVFHAHNSPTCFGPRTMYVTDLSFGGRADAPTVRGGDNTVTCVVGSPVVRAVGPWTVRVAADGQAGDFVIAPPAVRKVTDERIAALPLRNASKKGYGKKVKLEAVRSCECSVRGALDRNSVTVRDATGAVYAADRDYLVDPDGWGAIEALPDGRLGTNSAVLVSYSYRQQRLDSVVRTAEGQLALRVGSDVTRLPEPPALRPGDVRLVNVWVNAATDALSDENLYPVLEPPASAPRGVPASSFAPKTWAKLQAGEKVRILAWGDSVTACGYLPDADKWQEQFARRLRAKFPRAQIELVSNGWGGRNSRSFLNLASDHPYCYERTVLGVKPDLVVSEFVNDGGIPEQDVDKVYRKYLTDFRAIGAEWIVLTPHYTRVDWMRFRREKGNDADPRGYVKGLRTFAARNGVGLADASLRWGHLWREGLPYQTLFCNDINHPNAFGMGFFADALMALFE